LYGRGTVTRLLWDAQCNCPGADCARELEREVTERRSRTRAALADVDIGRGKNSAQIERQLRAGLEADEQPVPAGLAGWSQVLSAATARRGTRILRLLRLGDHAARSAARWNRQRAAGLGQVAWNPARGMYRTVLTSLLIAVAAAAAAAKSSRRRRIAFAILAVVAAGMSAWATLITAAITGIGRLADSHGQETEA
jgi:hypothetical protein